MANADDAKLLLELYELRREKVMRRARKFVLQEFFPQSADEIRQMLANPKQSAWFRQVVSYWEMAAAMVNHGSIDPYLFFDCNGEHLLIWAKFGHLVPELRQTFGKLYLKNLEHLAQQEYAQERLEFLRERVKQMAEARAAKK
jgi:hypothetical protein